MSTNEQRGAKDKRGARLRVLFREFRDELAEHDLDTGTKAIMDRARYGKPSGTPVELTAEETDWIWDGGWESRIREAMRGVSTGRIRSLHSVVRAAGRMYEQLSLLSYEEAQRLRDDYRDLAAANDAWDRAWTKILKLWARRGKELTLGEALDIEELESMLGQEGLG